MLSSFIGVMLPKTLGFLVIDEFKPNSKRAISFFKFHQTLV
jgi:hypothetical protein